MSIVPKWLTKLSELVLSLFCSFFGKVYVLPELVREVGWDSGLEYMDLRAWDWSELHKELRPWPMYPLYFKASIATEFIWKYLLIKIYILVCQKMFPIFILVWYLINGSLKRVSIASIKCDVKVKNRNILHKTSQCARIALKIIDYK